MSKFKMPKRRKDFENMLVNAFVSGMNCAYSVEHTECSDDEKVLMNRYRALIQGKINSMNEVWNDERIYLEKQLERK